MKLTQTITLELTNKELQLIMSALFGSTLTGVIEMDQRRLAEDINKALNK